MSNPLDNLLNNLSKQNKFDAVEIKESEQPIVVKEEPMVFNPSFLNESKPKSIIETLGVRVTDEEQQNFKSGQQSTGLSETTIRKIFAEELQKVMQNKTILAESTNGNEIIYFKVGKHLFKGTMELVESDK